MSEQTDTTIGVLLMAYGGPTSLDQIPAYLADVREGRPPSDELLTEMTHRYATIGGRSPILELTEAQARGIERALNQDAEIGIRYRAYAGMRHWHPYIGEVMPQIIEDGVDRLVAVVMAPHYSRMSVGRYMQRVDEALNALDARLPGRSRWKAGRMNRRSLRRSFSASIRRWNASKKPSATMSTSSSPRIACPNASCNGTTRIPTN